MNKSLIKVITIVVVVAVVYFGNKGIQTHLGKQAMAAVSVTVYSLEDAKVMAAQEGKLVLADYSATWCPSCRKLDTQIFANSDVAKNIEDDFIYARVDYDSEEGASFAKRHELVGFPRVLVLNKNGERLAEMPLTFDPLEYTFNLAQVTEALMEH